MDVGAYDDPNGSHISVEVVSSNFEGKRMVQRQQLVYKAIWEEMQGAVHAVDSMSCKTPSEAGKWVWFELYFLTVEMPKGSKDFMQGMKLIQFNVQTMH